MTQQQQVKTAISLMVQAVNLMLAAQNVPYRVKSSDIIMSRRDGYTLLALPETRDAADWRSCARPYSTMDSHS